MKQYSFVLLAMALSVLMCACDVGNVQNTINESETVSRQSEPTEIVTTANHTESRIDALIDAYNQTATKLEFVESFTPSDKDSGHYRTEFRLNAFSNAEGKSYKTGNNTVDIVCYGEDVRIYATLESLEESVQMIQTISPLLDPKMNQDELNEVLEYISEYKEANGKYYGNLGLTLFGSNETNYELMIKTD